MRIFENKSIFKKLIIVLICVIIISFCIPKGVNAEDENGGVLIKPIVSLFLSLGDGIMGLAHSLVLQQSEIMVILNGDSNVWAWLAGIVVAVAVVAVVTLTAGAAIPALVAAAPGVILTVAVVAGGVAGYATGAYVDSNWLEDDLKLPVFTLTPQEIFSNKIPLFDVDFFDPMEDKVIEEVVSPEKIELGDPIDLNYTINTKDEKTYAEFKFANHKFKVDITNASQSIGGKTESTLIGEAVMEYFKKNGKNVGSTSVIGENAIEYELIDNKKVPYRVKLYYIAQTRQNKYEYYSGKVIKAETQTKTLKSTAKQLQSAISNGYSFLRDIALVALLSVLVYIGIRIIISSTSSDKAKYKQLLIDWIVAICLLFVMQYIMSGSNLIVKKITDLLSSAGYPQYLVVLDAEQTKEAVKQINDASDGTRSVLAELGVLGKDQDANTLISTANDGTKYLNWNTNLFGILRVEAQFSKSGKMTYAGFMIMYVMLCLFTIYFIFTYLKRVIYMAFLTIIAPLVALTYPIDKINDGKAQAFNMWFKEYIFNLLIQPLHLLLYTVLVSSAIELASENVLYSIVAIAFLIPAEKLMRKFFGFEKAQTPGLLAGPAGAAMAMSGLNRLMGHRPPKHNESGKSGKNTDTSEDKKILFNNNYDKEEGIIDSMIGDDKVKQKENYLASSDNSVNPNNTKNNNSSIVNPMKNAELEQNNKKLLNTDVTNPNVPIKPAENRKIKKPSVKRGLQTAGRNYKNAMKRKIKNYASNAHPIRTATKFAVGAAGAAVFGTAAGIAGLTSGDPSKTFQYASAGVMGGYKLGDSIAGATQSMLDVPVDLNDAFRRGYYSSEEEYNQAAKEKYLKEMKKNEEIMQKLENKFGQEEAENIRDNVIDDYAEAGIYDIDDIIAGYQAEKDEHINREQIKSGIKYSKRIGQDTSKMKEDDLNKWEKTFSNEFAKNDRVREQNLDVEKLGKQTIDTVKIFNKYRYK